MSKTLIVLVVLTVLLVGVWVYIQLLGKKSGPSNSPEPIPIFTPAPSNYYPLPTAAEPDFKQLYIFNISPQQDLTKDFFPNTQIAITFSDLVNIEDLKYTVDPPVKTLARRQANTNTLIIYPETTWQEGVSSISIGQETKSVDGKPISESFTYQINTKFPPLIDMDKGI